MLKYLVWALLLIPSILIDTFGRICAPIVCLFIERKPRFDTVKRLGKQKVVLERDHLQSWLWWFDTFDNATDEYWYGMYPLSSHFTQAQYDNSRLIRYFMRVCWLQRNSMYGFTREYLSITPTSKLAWHYKGNVAIGFGYQMHINCGWKAHRGYTRLMYAGRPIGKITKKKG